MRFTERVAVDEPDFFRQYPEDLDSWFVFDIETLTDNYVDKKEIIAISVSDGKKIWCHQGKEKDILKAEIVKLRYFCGASIPEVAKILDVSPRTVDADWQFAKSFLKRELSREPGE